MTATYSVKLQTLELFANPGVAHNPSGDRQVVARQSFVGGLPA